MNITVIEDLVHFIISLVITCCVRWEMTTTFTTYTQPSGNEMLMIRSNEIQTFDKRVKYFIWNKWQNYTAGIPNTVTSYVTFQIIKTSKIHLHIKPFSDISHHN